MAKELKINMAAINQAKEKAGEAARKNTEQRKKEAAKGKRKPAGDYLRLDLSPGGIDLKTYVTTQAARESIETGRKISNTEYIQSLILKDKEKKENAPERETVAALLDKLPPDKLEAVKTVICALIK